MTKYMKGSRYILFLLLTTGIFIACNSTKNDSQPSSPTNSSSDSAKETSKSENLTKTQVEPAITTLLSNWRIGGSISVKGIQEVPKQNMAIADLQFNNFEFAVTGNDELLRAKDFKPPKKSNQLIPPPEEMFPQKKITYSKQGKAILTKYNDGRWMLKEVNWQDRVACCGVKGNVEIR